MTCEECRDLLPLYATGGLEAADAERVRQHLQAGCPACSSELTELEAAFHEVPRGLSPLQVPPGAWSNIEKRMALEQQVKGKKVVAQGRDRGTRISWVGWIAAAAVIVMAVLMWKDRNDATALNEQRQQDIIALHEQMTVLNGQVAVLTHDNDQLKTALATSKQQMLAQFVSMAIATPYELAAGAQSPQAKLFWNKADGTWTLVAAGLKPLPAGKTYELWIINNKDEKIPAGTFEPDEDGRAIHEVRLPANAGTIIMAAVTDEPQGGAAAPTGAIQFAGKL